MKKVMLLVLSCMMLSGCTINPFRGGDGSEREDHYRRAERTVSEPVIVSDSDGNPIYMGQREESTYTKEVDKKKIIPKETFMQRLGAWISGLTLFSVVAFVILFIITNGAIVGSIFRWGWKTSKVLKGVVKGVKESRMVQDGNGLHDALKNNLNAPWMKDKVDRIKARL